MSMYIGNRKPEIDQWLDDALAQYGKVEPRTGLESRVLARVQAERESRGRIRLSWFAIPAAAFAVGVFALAGLLFAPLPPAPLAAVARPPRVGEMGSANRSP